MKRAPAHKTLQTYQKDINSSHGIDRKVKKPASYVYIVS